MKSFWNKDCLAFSAEDVKSKNEFAFFCLNYVVCIRK